MVDPVKGKRPKWPQGVRDAVRADLSDDATPLRTAVRSEPLRTLRKPSVSCRSGGGGGRRDNGADLESTKKLLDDVRDGTNKIEQLEGRLVDLRRKQPKRRDARIYPGYYAPVMVWQEGQRVVVPTRYQCRPGALDGRTWCPEGRGLLYRQDPLATDSGQGRR